MSNLVKIKSSNFHQKLTRQVEADGGKTIVERLIRLFGVRNRLELAEVLDTHPGTFSTWQTRNTTPYEMLVRINLATGVPLEYLCFGEGSGVPDIFQKSELSASNKATQGFTKEVQNDELFQLPIFVISNGELVKTEELTVDSHFYRHFGIIQNDYAVEQSGNLLFINTQQQVITKGQYLFSVNGAYQVGELKQQPDGNTYFYDGSEKYVVNRETTQVHGKVVSVLNGG